MILGAAILISQDTQASPQASAACTVYYNGRVLTGLGLDSASPQRVSAFAVRAGTVTATGTQEAAEGGCRGLQAERVDLVGAFVMPGFNDAHTHLGPAGRIKLSVDLTGTRSLKEFQQRIAAAARTAAPGRWLTGGGWDHTLWPGARLPSRQDLDAVTAGHPAIFSRVDGHIAVANSAALAAAGVTASTPVPQGGKIDLDSAGKPTGIVRETARALVDSHIPPPTEAERRRGLALAMADAATHGVTSVQDNSDWEDFRVLEQMENEGKLPIRVSEWLSFDASPLVLIKERASHPAADRMLRTTMLKGFMDGSLGSRTAALNAPYADDKTNSGIPRYTRQQLIPMTVERARAGFQIGFHAIGDRAVDMALDAFAAAEQADPAARHTRFRIEHSQVDAPGDFARYKQLGVIASMQPNHLLTDMNWAGTRLGPEREPYAYAWRSFLKAGVPVAFGTDYPVEPITPFRGVYSAVTRQNESGTRSFHPEEKLTIGEALVAYTQASAYAEFSEPWKGMLVPGYVADFIVLDRDLTTAEPAEILQTRVLETVVGGKAVYKNRTPREGSVASTHASAARRAGSHLQ